MLGGQGLKFSGADQRVCHAYVMVLNSITSIPCDFVVMGGLCDTLPFLRKLQYKGRVGTSNKNCEDCVKPHCLHTLVTASTLVTPIAKRDNKAER